MTKPLNYVSAQAYEEPGNDGNKSALTAVRAREPSSVTFDPIKSPVLQGKLFGRARAVYPSTKPAESQAIRQVSHICKRRNKRTKEKAGVWNENHLLESFFIVAAGVFKCFYFGMAHDQHPLQAAALTDNTSAYAHFRKSKVRMKYGNICVWCD